MKNNELKLKYAFRLLFNGQKTILLVVLAVFSFVLSLLSISFNEGIQYVGNDFLYGRYDALSASISKVTIHEFEDSVIKVQESYRPLMHEVESLERFYENIKVDYDYSYVLGSEVKYQEDEQNIEAIFSSVFSSGSGLAPFLEGENIELFDYRHVVVNDAFYNQYYKDSNIIGHTIPFKKEIVIQTMKMDKEIYDVVSLSFPFKIVGIVKEKSILNMPTIYYSQEGASKLFKQITLENVSSILGRPYSLYERFEDSNASDPLGNYSLRIGVSNKEQLYDLYSTVNLTNTYKVESQTLLLISSFKDLTNAISLLLKLFTGLCFSVLMIVFVIQCYISLRINERDIGILHSLGLSKIRICCLYSYPSLICTFVSILLTLVIYEPIKYFINIGIVRSFNINHLLISYGSTYGKGVFICLLALLLSFIVNFFATYFLLNKKTTYILEEE
ncbi:MAG: ABC transporter permease [Bacilli bacterium]|nr:ABC transporter permease [Bacilli bacterium]